MRRSRSSGANARPLSSTAIPSSKRPDLPSWPPSSRNAGGNGGRRAAVRRNWSIASSPRPAASNAAASKISIAGSWLRRAAPPPWRGSASRAPGREHPLRQHCRGSTSTHRRRGALPHQGAASATQAALFQALDCRGSAVRCLRVSASTSVSTTKQDYAARTLRRRRRHPRSRKSGRDGRRVVNWTRLVDKIDPVHR